MLSKLLTPNAWSGLRCVGFLRPPPPVLQTKLKEPSVRHAGHMIPPSQYDIPMSPKFKLSYALAKYWELIPMFITVCTSMALVVLITFWSIKNKVDVVFSTHSCSNISRTMNLRAPTVHKIVIINQRYDPWPEMQEVLEKMLVAEHYVNQKSNCGHAKVDVVFSTHSRENISRTMDLRNPSIHKIVIINQRYKDWDEMQRVLDRMKDSEKREKARAQSCPCHPHA